MQAPFKVERMNEEAKKASSNQKHDFSEYMWMADLESFDREVRSEIEEEDYIRSSIELLLVEEERDTVYYKNNGTIYPPQSNGLVYNEHGEQYNYGGDFYVPEPIEHPMGNLAINEFNPQQYYNQGPQQMLDPNAQFSVYQQNDMMHHQFHQHIPYNGYFHLQSGQQNGYQNDTEKYDQTQNSLRREVQNTTPHGKKALNPEASEFIPSNLKK